MPSGGAVLATINWTSEVSRIKVPVLLVFGDARTGTAFVLTT
jgi:hypothetical protein